MLLVLKYLQMHPCIDCGETDLTCLDFDHVKGHKVNDISGMISNTYSEENILKEIEKCEVRCSNCHRKKTAKERDWYNYIDFNTMTLIE
jgi:L-lactate utilization protein LutB